MPSPLAIRLLDWYSRNKRTLPWRDHPDSYVVWVSEIMCQQTRVEAVIPYFESWMRRFPTLASLANAELTEVLRVWEGLGYYSRARNLHKAAQVVMEKYQGELPRSAAELRKLPGIGRYTAGAIASLGFGQDEAALDGNIRRVMARVFNVAEPDRSPRGEAQLWHLAQEHLPSGQAGNYNQAIMDLGALVCTPRNPSCNICPLKDLCMAYALDLQAARPVRLAKAERPHHIVTAAVLQNEGKVLIARRPDDGLLGGLWEFPGGKLKQGESLAEGLRREIHEELAAKIEVDEKIGTYEHAFTHFSITLHAFRCRLTNGASPLALEHSALAWVRPTELDHYPMGKVDRQIARSLQQEEHNDETASY